MNEHPADSLKQIVWLVWIIIWNQACRPVDMYNLHVCLSSSFYGSFMALLQLADILNELAECQGKFWTMVQRNPQAKRRGPTQY